MFVLQFNNFLLVFVYFWMLYAWCAFKIFIFVFCILLRVLWRLLEVPSLATTFQDVYSHIFATAICFGHLQVEYRINCWKLLHLQRMHFIWSGPFFALVEKNTTWLRIACHNCQSVMVYVVCWIFQSVISLASLPPSSINLIFWWVAHNHTASFTCSSRNTVTTLQWCTFREDPGQDSLN
jgi:hypothetical protein